MVSTDLAGNTTIADVEGTPFEFNAYTFQSVFEDGFETDIGWTLEGDWQIDAPQGLGTAPGDPTAASEGIRVLGHDLTGLGSTPGDYERLHDVFGHQPRDRRVRRDQRGVAIRPLAQPGHQRRCVRLRQGRDPAPGRSHGRAPGADRVVVVRAVSRRLRVGRREPELPDSVQRVHSIGKRRRLERRSSHLRDSTQATFVPCGACGGTPTFAGAVSAIDDDPCADSPVTVTWAAAPAWGTGGGGTYGVYRDTIPGFTPSGANLIASGIVTLSWVDASPPSDVPLYYVVRAENDETCGRARTTGEWWMPTCTESSPRTLPGNPYPEASAAPCPWTKLTGPMFGSTGPRRVGRPATACTARFVPDTGFVIVDQPIGPTYRDVGALLDGQDAYYLVTAINACGGESPD